MCETLAKLVVGNPKVEDQTLGGMFEGYRKRSELPGPLLDYILETYKRRNSEPLAGHGATKPPSVTAQEASILIEMTKMCVRLERRLAVQEMDSVPTAVQVGTAKPKATRSVTKLPSERRSAVAALTSGKKPKKIKKPKRRNA